MLDNLPNINCILEYSRVECSRVSSRYRTISHPPVQDMGLRAAENTRIGDILSSSFCGVYFFDLLATSQREIE